MAYPPLWQPDARQPHSASRDWRGLLGSGVAGLLTLAMVMLVIAMIWFLVMVFTADDDGQSGPPRGLTGAPAGEQGIGQAIRSESR